MFALSLGYTDFVTVTAGEVAGGQEHLEVSRVPAVEKIGIARGNEDKKIMCVNLGTHACPLISQLFSTLIC